METILETISSPVYRQTMFAFSIVSLFFAAAFIIVAFAYYGRTRDVYGKTSEKQRWTLLMGTWRDSLIITLLFLSEGMIYRFSSFQGISEKLPNTVLLYGPTMTDVSLMVLYIAIFAITILRIILISRWLSDQKNAG